MEEEYNIKHIIYRCADNNRITKERMKLRRIRVT